MNKTLYYFGLILIVCIFYSCEDSRNIQYYNLNIELSEPIPNLKESDPLPDYLKVFISYTDTSSAKDLFVPEVTFARTDINSTNSFKPEPPLTWINKFRKGRGMLPAEYLKEDYNSLINKLITPKILTEAKGKTVSPSTEATDYADNTFFLNIYKVKPDSVKALKEKITHKLLSSKGNITVKLVVVNKPFEAQTALSVIEKDTINKAQESKTENVKPVVVNDKKRDPVVSDNEPKPEYEGKMVTANSFEEYLQKIGDQSIKYPQKGNLKTGIVEMYFVNGDAMVVFIGPNGNEVSHTKVKAFIEDLSQRNFKFQVLDKKTDANQKITTLNIQEK